MEINIIDDNYEEWVRTIHKLSWKSYSIRMWLFIASIYIFGLFFLLQGINEKHELITSTTKSADGRSTLTEVGFKYENPGLYNVETGVATAFIIFATLQVIAFLKAKMKHNNHLYGKIQRVKKAGNKYSLKLTESHLSYIDAEINYETKWITYPLYQIKKEYLLLFNDINNVLMVPLNKLSQSEAKELLTFVKLNLRPKK